MKTETKKQCRHRFIEASNYTAQCKYCGEKKDLLDNFGVKIILGIFGFDPEIWEEETNTINILHEGECFGYQKWHSLMEKEMPDFDKLDDKEKFKLYKEQTDYSKKRKT